mgnify:CR=1 FL=1
MADQYSDPVTRRNRYSKLQGQLWTDRSSFDAHWRDLGDFFQPRRMRWSASDRNRGDKRNQNIINSTGRYAARTLQSGLHAGLTSPARPWMKLTIPDQDLSEFGAVREWLHVVTTRMMTILGVSNVYNVLPTVYGDLGVFGTAAMFLGDDPQDLARATAYPIGSYALGTDARGVVSTFVREYELTVRQVIELFGLKENGRDIDWSNLSKTVKHLWDSGDYESTVEVCWLVKPNEEHRRDRLEARFLPFASCHWEKGSSEAQFLRESGFRNFPIMAPRWDITGEDSYGTDCPGMTSLGDNKQLQIMERRHGQALNKMVDPPLVGPTSMRTQKTSLLAGDVNYVDVREGMQSLRAVHEIRIDLSHLGENIRAVEQRINRAFFADLFLMMANSDPYRGASPTTAREIEERHEEKLLALGPVLERTNDELLDPLVDRLFNMMDNAGLLPPPPPEIEGADLKVEYISILAQAQKLVGVAATDRFVGTIAPMLEVFPEMRNKIDSNRVVNGYADMLGIDPRIIISDEQADAATAAQQQQQAGAAQAEQAALVAKSAKDASQAQLGTNSALDRVVEGFGG